MRRIAVITGVVVLAAGIGVWLYQSGGSASSATGVPGGSPRGTGGAGSRPTMTVELATASRAKVAEHITVVGNLIGALTVDVVPKVSGRLESVAVRLGDSVRKGQLLAKLEDGEIQEQVRQTVASLEVSKATVRQREADLTFALTSLERSRNLFSRNLLARQALDDAQARYDAAVAQVDLAKAQLAQSGARAEELQINLTNTRIVSPVDGFVGSRRLDPGAFVGPGTAFISVVDIHFVRLVANLVERDLRKVNANMPADVDVDAFPGEVFKGRVARIAPVLNPATRTAEMEVEVPNASMRLKPGMYARVRFMVEERPNALVVPRNAVVDVEGRRGVFVAADRVARFRPVESGLQTLDLIEVVAGLTDGDRVVTTGAGGLKDGDPIVLAGQGPGGGRGSTPVQGVTGGRPGGGGGGQTRAGQPAGNPAGQ